jgi:hypothetical protein
LFRVDPEIEGKGLDYEHAVLAVGRLAKFHAVSYAYRYILCLNVAEPEPHRFTGDRASEPQNQIL